MDMQHNIYKMTEIISIWFQFKRTMLKWIIRDDDADTSDSILQKTFITKLKVKDRFSYNVCLHPVHTTPPSFLSAYKASVAPFDRICSHPNFTK